MSKNPRIAVVGAGSMGSFHARVIAASERAELVRVVDPHQANGQSLAEKYGVTWTPELDGLTDVDAVVVAAATPAHQELAMRVFDAGKPLLLEKPIAGELVASEEIVATAAKMGVPLMCGYVERFNPAILTVLPMLNEPVHFSAVRHGPYAPRIRTGVAWDLLIHDVDACLRLIGGGVEPKQVGGGLGYFHHDSEAGAEDVAEAIMRFPHGPVGTASASRIGQRKVRSISINEVDRAIEVDLLRRDVTVYRHVGHEPAADGLGYRQQTVIEIPELVSVREPLAAQLDRFVDLINGVVDADEERDSILPAHRVVAEVMTFAPEKAA